MTEENQVREAVRQHYAGRARELQGGASSQTGRAACCGPDPAEATMSPDLYAVDEVAGLPQEAVVASLGCGNPVAVADLRPGEVVLDLGSGGGIDVLLSARRVGPSGKAYGLDMTDEMLALAQNNARRAGVTNAEFLKGEMEDIPLPGSSVDAVISNCVVNLSSDKGRVLAEAYRVLKPGGRIAIADIVVRREIPAELRRSLELWAGCVAGALEEGEYVSLLEAAGLTDIQIEVVKEYTPDDAEQAGLSDLLRRFGGREGNDLGFVSAIVRARRPGGETLERNTVDITPTTARQRGGCC